MEGNLLLVLAYMGALSLYLVTASIVGRAIYKATRSWSNDDDRIIIACLGGAFFPMTVPFAILIVWVWSFIGIPLGSREDQDNGNERSKERKADKSPASRQKFKAGDLVTGVKGNPGDYEIFYEGCVCRVLDVGRRNVKIKLVDHIDREANEESFGRVAWASQEYFTLIKQPAAKKKSVKKKK